MSNALDAYPIIQIAVAGAIAMMTVVAAIMGLRKKWQPETQEHQFALFAHLVPTLDVKLTNIDERTAQMNGKLGASLENQERIEARIQRVEDRLERIEERTRRR